MSKINYVVGDATRPQGEGNKIICHVCNDIGIWGGGFVIAVSKRWGFPEHFYRARQKYPLGHVDILSVDSDEDGKNIIFVANMIAQHNIRWSTDGVPPIRYEALREALTKVNARANTEGASLHMPRIGSDRAGGKWELIEAIIEQCTDVPVTVYDLP